MRKLFLLLATTVAMVLAVGCDDKSNDDITPNDKTEQPDDKPEGKMLASTEEQMEAIANSIPQLKATATALNNLTNAITPSNVELATRNDNNSNNGVKAQIAELEKRIEELEKYIANGGSADQEWLDATYVTLDMYEQTIALLASLQVEVDALKSQISSTNYELFAEVDNKIDSSCESMKGWVSEQLSGYYNIAEVDALLAQMEASLTEENAELRTAMNKLREDIEQTLSEMRKEYKDAIAEAINEYDGVITEKIAKEIKAVNERIDSEISALNKRVDDIEARLEELENAVENLIKRIQSITYIPTHEDGKARVDCHNTGIWGSTMSMDFIISPKSAVADIAERYEEILALKANIVGTTDFANLPITSCTADTKNGTLSIEASCDKLGDNFYHMKNSARVMLTVSDGNNDRNTEYIPTRPRFHKQANNMIFYTSTDGKIVNPKDDWDNRPIIDNTYDGDYGVLVFDGYIYDIPDFAFANNARLKSITLPETLTTIGEEAFAECSALQHINIPEKVYHIGKYAFRNCYSFPDEDGLRYADTYLIEATNNQATYTLKENTRFIGESAFAHSSIESIVIPHGVREIKEETFAFSSLTSITIPDSVLYIETRAFNNCQRLTNVTIPDSVVRIGDYAFECCLNLTDVTLGNGVSEIGESAFSQCSSLARINIPDGVVGDYAFELCLNLTNVTLGNGVTWIGNAAFLWCESLTSINIPDSVRCIERYAFMDCSSLTSITIGNGVTWIGDRAFSRCESLTSITIPNSVTEIGEAVFDDCKSLASIHIPDGVTSIGDSVFTGCISLVSVTIPDGVTSIGDSAFSRCESLTSITIPNSVTEIGEAVFYDCKSLASVTIPDGVTSIGDSAFSRCESLTSITIPNSVIEIGKGAFSDCKNLAEFQGKFASEDGYCLIINDVLYGFAPSAATNEYVIPNGVTSIGDSAFGGCSSLTNITIPNSVTEIGDRAFGGCSSLTSITIPNSVTEIGEAAFNDCYNITSVTIPESVTSIGNHAFNSYACERIYIKSKTPIKAPPASLDWWYPFDYNIDFLKIYVPTESVEAYKTALGWKFYADCIEGYDFE